MKALWIACRRCFSNVSWPPCPSGMSLAVQLVIITLHLPRVLSDYVTVHCLLMRLCPIAMTRTTTSPSCQHNTMSCLPRAWQP